MTTLEITTKDSKRLCVEWSDAQNLKRWMARQRTRSGWIEHLSDKIFFGEYQKWIQSYWSTIENINGFNLPSDPRILDIGSGIGIVDLFLALYFPDSRFILLDRNLDAPIKENRYGDLHPFYNSWEPTLDAIKTTKLNLDRFEFITPEQPWPENVDLISSHFSWCWHYDVFTYLDKTYNSLNKGGLLLLSVRFTDTEDVMKILDDKFGKRLDFLYFEKKDQIKTEKEIFNVPGPYFGGLGIWQKQM